MVGNREDRICMRGEGSNWSNPMNFPSNTRFLWVKLVLR